VLADPVRRRTAARLAGPLRALLVRSGLLHTLWFPRGELLLWILVTGACVADTERQADWFAARVGTVCAHLGVASEAGLREVLRWWFYIEERQGGGCGEVVCEGAAARWGGRGRGRG
jgi:hypothetical protein